LNSGGGGGLTWCQQSMAQSAKMVPAVRNRSGLIVLLALILS
jgi:hypothetical protein